MTEQEQKKLLEDNGFKKLPRTTRKPHVDLWQKHLAGHKDSEGFFINAWNYDLLNSVQTGKLMDFDVQIRGRDGIVRNILWFGNGIESKIKDIENEAMSLFIEFDERA